VWSPLVLILYLLPSIKTSKPYILEGESVVGKKLGTLEAIGSTMSG